MEREKELRWPDEPSQFVGCCPTDSDWTPRSPGFKAPFAGTQAEPRSVSPSVPTTSHL